MAELKNTYTFAGAGKDWRTLSAAKKAAKTYARKHGESVRIMKHSQTYGHEYTGHTVQPNPSARSKSKRMSAALKKYLHSLYPHKTLAGAKVQKNPGGSITIVPIHLRKRSR